MTSLLDLELSRDDLVEQIMNFIQEGEVEGITDTVALLDSFDRLEAQIATKVDAIAAVVAAKEGEIAYLKKRRDHFNSQIEVRENALSNFRTYLKKIAESRGDLTIKGREATIKLVKNGGKQPLWTNEIEALKDTMGVVGKLPIVIDDTSASDLTPAKMRSVLRQIRHERGELGLIVLDYIQKLGDRAANNRA
jgi:cell division protein FtsB